MVVSLAGRLGDRPFNRVRVRCNDDLCTCTVTQHSLIGWGAIIRTIGGELVDLIVDLVQQRLQLRGIAALLICQTMGNDLATVGINRQIQLSPAAPGLCPMLLFQPLAGSRSSVRCCRPEREWARQPHSVGRCVYRMASRFWPVGSAWCDRAQTYPIPSYQAPNAKVPRFGAAAPKYHAQRQRSFDRQI